MKKWWIGLVVLFLLMILCIYIFILKNLPVSKVVYLNASYNTVNRLLYNKDQWLKWWPASHSEKEQHNGQLYFNNTSYLINQRLFNGAVHISDKNKSLKSNLITVSVGSDSTAIEWKTTVPTGLNPIEKITGYGQAKKMKENMTSILESFKQFVENEEKVYGLVIQQTRVKDTAFIATRFSTATNPHPSIIYKKIDELKAYIASQSARATDYPMLHVATDDSIGFDAMVAIPVNKVLPDAGDMVVKRMIRGNILMAEVRGGNGAIREAFQQMENYITDYKKISPAIPYQSLITDRRKEPDTAKWITKIYYPVL